MQDVRSDSSLGAGNDLALHFGLGAASVDAVRITWPDGSEAALGPLEFDRSWTVIYPGELELFSDSFESGDTSRWTATVP